MPHKSYYHKSHYRERGTICGVVRPSGTGVYELLGSPPGAEIMHHVP